MAEPSPLPPAPASGAAMPDGGEAASMPRQGTAPAGALELLLKIEADARRAATPAELAFLAANETLRVTRSRQIFVLARHGRGLQIEAVSSVGKVDRNAPRLRWIEDVVAALADDAGLDKPREFALPAYCRQGEEEHKTYPFRFMAWVPLALASGDVFGGMLLAREIPWIESDQLIAARLGETYAHAWAALAGSRKLTASRRPTPLVLAAAAALLLAVGVYPVPLSVLAPAEVAPIAPLTVAAPFDGIIAALEVEPNQMVAKGQVLARLSDVALRNDLAVAERDVGVAEARLRQVSQAAVADAKARGEIATTRAELELARAKRDYAADLLARSAVMAPGAGVAVFSDARDLVGRPVQPGTRIMDVADPARVELRVDLPVADAIAIRPGAPVRAFLDSDPLRPVDAEMISASYEPTDVKGGGLAYRVRARIKPGQEAALRLGIRGTAQLVGDEVPLAFYLFRRPLAAARQWLGL